MERRLIRERWQITIPAKVRRRLNLFVGQTLNFEVDDVTGNIHVFTGSYLVPADEAAFREVLAEKARQKRKPKWAKKSRKSDIQGTLRRLQEAAKRAREHSENFELQQVLSDLSGYLLNLQTRLRKSTEA